MKKLILMTLLIIISQLSLPKEELFSSTTIRDITHKTRKISKAYTETTYTIKSNNNYAVLSVIENQKKIKKSIFKKILTSINKLFNGEKPPKTKSIFKKRKNNLNNGKKYKTTIKPIFHAYEWPNKENDLLAKNYKTLNQLYNPDICRAKMLLYKYWLEHDKTIIYNKKLVKQRLNRLKKLSTKPLHITKEGHDQLSDLKIKTH